LIQTNASAKVGIGAQGSRVGQCDLVQRAEIVDGGHFVMIQMRRFHQCVKVIELITG
jgi:hypothetical protein